MNGEQDQIKEEVHHWSALLEMGKWHQDSDTEDFTFRRNFHIQR